jgi:ferredoxin-type protein NapG
VIDKAITLEPRHNTRTGKHAYFIPTVHPEACTGCGKCEKSCVLDAEAAIKVLPIALASAGGSGHYRLGWKEKENAGRPLLPDVLELPARRPEGGH